MVWKWRIEPTAIAVSGSTTLLASATVQFVDKAFALNGKIKVEDIYTNDLVK